MDAKTVLLLDELDRPPVPGPPGKRGLTGPRGLRGHVGGDGLPGLKGDKGDKGNSGQDGKDGTRVARATAHSLPPEREPTAEFNKDTGLLTFGIPRGEKGKSGVSGTPRVSPRTGNLLFGGGGSGSGEHPSLAAHDALGLATDAELAAHAATSHGTTHPNLAVHDTLGLATDAELAAHAATLHDAAIPTYIQDTDPALTPPAKYLWVDTNTDFLWYNDGQVG